MTRLHREAKELFFQHYQEKLPGASLETARRRVAEKYGCASWQHLRDATAHLQNGLPGEADPAHLQFLVDAGAKEHPHSGSYLYDHLEGTRDLLAEWGAPEHLATAGLFHSIYGTETYKISSVPLERRREVAARIGDHAEALAYVFCVSHRADFLTQLGSDTPKLTDVVNATEIAVSHDDLEQLIELEVANCVEQIYPERAQPWTVPLLKGMLGAPISEGARASLGDLVSKCETNLHEPEPS